MKRKPIGISVVLLLITTLICSTIGSADLEVWDVLCSIAMKIFGGAEILPDTQAMILYRIRLPRVLFAVVAGAGLSMAGLTLQGLFRNPLADPYIIGISSGSALGAAIAIATGVGSTLLGNLTTSVFAFIGAMAALGIVYQLGREGRTLRQGRVLLAGIAVGQLFSAGLSLLLVFYAQQMDKIVYWTMGSLAGNHMRTVLLCMVIALGGYIVMHVHRTEMNLLLLGEDTAKSMGVNTEQLKRILLITASFVTAVVVSFTGIIGFVGLIVPHIARFIIGPDYRTLLPASALWGGIFLSICDTAARTIASPLEIPIGIVTAMIGAPFFLWLLRGREGRGII